MVSYRYTDRSDAGRRLAAALEHLRTRDPLVIGLPRGGAVVAAEVARALGAPLDVLVVRKLGAPGQPELGLGAVAEGGVVLLNKRLMRQIRVSKEQLQGTIDRENEEMKRRVDVYRGDREPIEVAGRTVILVDDGLATGSTARAAIGALHHLGAGEVILAVPVGAPSTVRELESMADEVVCLSTPRMLMSIGQHYDDFTQTGDAEVVELLAELGR
jgi:predicted phosphoribosyltransferase